MVLYYWDLLFGPPIEASSIDRTQQSRFHLRTREEPSLETLWFKNIGAMDEVSMLLIWVVTSVPSGLKTETVVI
jgi:hypothetical protein